ncbi:MAG TPA: peptide-methionine (S)-S-oxide reductase MsrA, partial [Roseiarcus sp.]|nr:peptide-methionine (S)-S-oxide reductase MsrA [Roseiarcus sp.]
MLAFLRNHSTDATLIAGALVAAVVFAPRSEAEQARRLPLPAADEPAGSPGSEVAVVAGGCFWGVQGVFQHVDGVVSAVSGYDGGAASTAHYEMTSRGDTGHAESVRITYDPRKITYGKILQIFFSVAHDPTELDRQGPDEGTQYRSAIFPSDVEQASIARDYIAQLDKAHVFRA